jgi:hypothetical protein
MIARELRAFAEDPNPFLPRSAGTRGVDDARYFAVVGPRGEWISASRLRLAADEVADVVAEVRALAPGPVEWSVGASATPQDLPERLRELGCVDPRAPLEPHVAALALDHPPEAVEGVEVRKVETFEDFLVVLELSFEASPRSPGDEAKERDRAPATYERRRSRPGGDWLAYLDGRPAAAASAIAGPAGLFLAGGGTACWARGRGCYRALVRARWDEAVRLGTPGLAVHAQHGSSQPILERLGFEHVCDLHVVVDPA